MAKMTFENPTNGYREAVDGSTIAGAFFLGPLYLLAKGLWTHALVWTCLAAFLLMVAAPFIIFLIPIYAAMTPSLMKTSFLRRGWVEVVEAQHVGSETIKPEHSRISHVERRTDASAEPEPKTISPKPVLGFVFLAALVGGTLLLASIADNSSSISPSSNRPETENLIQITLDDRAPAPSSPYSVDKELDFHDCKSRVDATAANHKLNTSTVVDTDMMYMVRFAMAEGSVLASCSSMDNKLVVTRSPYP